MKQRSYTTAASAIGMLILILDAPTALSFAREGVQLCLQTLIPSLFPFFVCSVLLTGSLAGISSPVLHPLEKSCRIPEGSGALLLVGFLGGYPVGAQNIGLAYERGQLSKEDARRMLGFCNNAGPAFLFGMVGSFFDNPIIPWLLWLIHIASALIVARIIPGKGASFHPNDIAKPLSLTEAVDKSIRVMASVCGWVILFRIIIGFLDSRLIFLFPSPVQILLNGALELSNGCIHLGEIPCEGLRFITASVMLAFGGLCVVMQTRAVTAGISLDRYFPGKLLQYGISFLLSVMVQGVFPAGQRYIPSAWVIVSFAAVVFFLSTKLNIRENKGRNPAVVGV